VQPRVETVTARLVVVVTTYTIENQERSNNLRPMVSVVLIKLLVTVNPQHDIRVIGNTQPIKAV